MNRGFMPNFMNAKYTLFFTSLWILFIALSFKNVTAQAIRNVSFDVTSRNTVEISYLLSAPKFSQQYNVKLFISKDGGMKYFSPKTIVGDVGTVSGDGTKKIIWHVLSDFDVFECEKCVVKITAKEIVTFKNRLTTIFFGSDKSKSALNGVILQFGVFDLSFENESFKNSVSSGVLNPSFGYDIGLKSILSPSIFDVSISYQEINYSETSALDTIKFIALNISQSVFLFPVLKIVVPYLGIGYQLSELWIGDWNEPVSQIGTSAVFWKGGVQANFGIWRMGADFKQSIGRGNRQWQQFIFYVGYGGKLTEAK